MKIVNKILRNLTVFGIGIVIGVVVWPKIKPTVTTWLGKVGIKMPSTNA